MGEIRRKTPALPDRQSGEWQPPPQFIRVPLPGVQPVAANPVIAGRVGQDLLEDPRALVPARHLPFPYWQAAPASPVIGYRYGRDQVLDLAAFVLPRYEPFPFFQALAASPLIVYRYGARLGEGEAPFVLPRYLPYPFFQAAPPPGAASPVIGYLMGVWPREVEEMIVSPLARFGRFPFFSAGLPEAVSAVYLPALRRRRR